jgi:methyl-accepting chemotaxis protein
MTLNETEKYNFNINYNPDLNTTNLWINAPVFSSEHKPIGILGTGIDLTVFIDSIYRGYTGRASLYFFNDLGEITGAKDSRLVAAKKGINEELSAVDAEILSRTKNLRPGEVQVFNYAGGEIAVGTVPALNWYVTAVMPQTLADYLSTTMTVLFMSMLGVLALIFIGFNLFIVGLLGPLKKMINVLDQISADWNLTHRLEIRQKDEIGTLAEFFNLTFEKIMALVKNIKAETFSLFDTGDELTANMIEASTSLTMINNSVQTMKEKVSSQASEVGTTVTTIEKLIGQLDTLNKHIAIQFESVTQSSSAIEQMLANIHSVTQTLVKNTTNISSLAKSSDAGRTDLHKVSGDIQKIAHESEGLLQINAVMQAIASQTNLLSMNAAIEAAHAGEAGKGFAVVASEIRKLAENSSAQSKTITDVLKRIKDSIDTITKSTGIVIERFGDIEEEVKTVSSQESQIRNAMEEQGVGSRNILDAITQLNEVTELVRSASKDMANDGNEILKQSIDLRQLTADVLNSMGIMAESASHISNAVTRVNEISQENKDNIISLSGEVARFKIEETK